jgi:predicted AlkP superfamily phosphohydrolase/phosphomutase
MSDKSINPAQRVILLGLDGASYRLLKPWAEEGILPNFARMFEESTWGELASTIPPTTPPAWAACLTGKNPGKHGIFDFRESPLKYPDRPLINMSSMQGRKLWHLFAAKGKKSAIVNVPITFPPDDTIDGLMVSGMMTPSNDSEYTYPAELKSEILNAVGDYVVNIDIPKYDVELEDDANAFLQDVEYSFTKRKELFWYLLDAKPWHFFMIVFVNLDRIQHLFWKYLDPEWPQYESKMAKRLRPRIIKSYQMVDEMLGELRQKAGETPIVIMSDHGFGATRQWFNVNTWLMQNGWLKANPDVLRKRKIFMTLMNWNDSPLVKALVPKSVQSKVRGKIRSGRSTFKSDLESALDYSGTKAFFASIPAQGIFINVKRDGAGIVEPGTEYDQLRAEIKEKLLQLKDPETGKNVVDHVYFREELYHGEQAKYAADVIFVARNYGCLGRQLIGQNKVLQSSARTPNGFHRVEGVFMAIGPQFKSGARLEGAQMPDVAPTILHLAGQPIPDDMDGRVLSEIFTPEYMEANAVTSISVADLPELDRKDFSEEESAEIANRLRSLGYLE